MAPVIFIQKPVPKLFIFFIKKLTNDLIDLNDLKNHI